MTNNLKVGQTLNVYYLNRIHKGKVLWLKSNKAGLVLNDPFNWRFGETFITIPNSPHGGQ